MISVLIPVYNYDVSSLVKDIKDQFVREKLEFEIIIIDDSSANIILPEPSILNDERIKFEKLYINVGRSRIRNLLASKAKYDYLLFLDCDSDVSQNPNFIINYVTNIEKSEVQYGGTLYSSIRPDFKYLLHWSYGRQVESPKAEIRAKDPYDSFKTNNFMIKKSVFESVKFDEAINTYGYEDYKFAIELNSKNYTIKHINNEVIHNGLNENEEFLSKIEISLKTLVKLFKSGQIDNTKLLK